MLKATEKNSENCGFYALASAVVEIIKNLALT